MTNDAITEAFLLLLNKRWKDPAQHHGFQELRKQLPEQGNWKQILESRQLALENKAEEAVALLQAMLDQEPQDSAAALMLAYILSHDVHDYQGAVDVLDSLLRQGFEGLVKPAWFEALALLGKVLALAYEKKWDAALETIQELWDRFGAPQDPFLARVAAGSLVVKSYVYESFKNIKDIYRVCEEAERYFGESTEPGIQELVVMVLVNKGATLDKAGQRDKAIQTCEEIERRFGESTEPGIQEQVARALVNKGVTLNKAGQRKKSIKTCEEIEFRFGESTEPSIQEQVARALVSKGWILEKIGQMKEAIQVCVEVERRFGKLTEPGIQEQVARALVIRGWALSGIGQMEEAIQVCEETERRFGKSTESDIQKSVARALVNKGVALGKIGQREEAIQVYEEVECRFGKAIEPGIQEQVAKALLNKGVALGQSGHPKKGILTFEELDFRFGEATEPGIQKHVAMALLNKGWTCGKLEDWAEASKAYQTVVDRFGQSSEPKLCKWVVEAQLRLSLVLLETGQKKKARTLFKSIQEQLLKEQELKEDLAALYSKVASRFASKPKSATEQKKQRERDFEITRGNVAANLQMMLDYALKEIDEKTQKKYFKQMDHALERIDGFITDPSCFSDELSFLLVLREWNSYTPVIPAAEESDRGGGYYIRHAGQGIVIDPGYNFIENFHRAGGRLNGIDHIIVTHAHDDHTAELEALLMLFNRRRNEPDQREKTVNLYLSAGVQRKFTGLLNLCDPKYGKVVTLCRSARDFEQRIKLNESTTLTVLPAYHDDVITRDSAVGLGFEFKIGNTKRRIVFTADSGLYPRSLKSDGEYDYYDPDTKKNPKIKAVPGEALFEQYPDAFRNETDLVVAHIGSIKKQEFDEEAIPAPHDDSGNRFYPNHLGLLGTLLLLEDIHPEAAVISEFGAELKGFHIDLVEKLGKALNAVQEKKKTNKRKTLVLAGDLTTAYDITNHRFLSHSQCQDHTFKFVDIDKLICRKAKDFLYKPKWSEGYDVSAKPNATRAYLFRTDADDNLLIQEDNRNAKQYAISFYEKELPYQTKTCEEKDKGK